MYGYYCIICKKEHNLKSKIGKEHYSEYLLEKDRLDRLADFERTTKKQLTKEELDRMLYKDIFGEKE